MRAGSPTSARAFSLAETLVAGGLSLMLFTLLARFMVPLLACQQKGSELADMQRQATLSLELLKRDLAQTAPAGVSLAPTAVGIQPIDGMTDEGDVMWRQQEVVYSWSGSQLSRGVWNDPGGSWLGNSRPTRLDVQPLLGLVAQTVDRRVLSGQVVSFSVAPAGSDAGLTFPLTLQLEVCGPLSGRHYRLQETVAARTVTL